MQQKYYKAIKKKQLPLHGPIWVGVREIMPGKSSQHQKCLLCKRPKLRWQRSEQQKVNNWKAWRDSWGCCKCVCLGVRECSLECLSSNVRKKRSPPICTSLWVSKATAEKKILKISKRKISSQQPHQLPSKSWKKWFSVRNVYIQPTHDSSCKGS